MSKVNSNKNKISNSNVVSFGAGEASVSLSSDNSTSRPTRSQTLNKLPRPAHVAYKCHCGTNFMSQPDKFPTCRSCYLKLVKSVPAPRLVGIEPNPGPGKRKQSKPQRQLRRKGPGPARDTTVALSKALTTVFPDFLKTKMRIFTNYTQNNASTPLYFNYRANDVLRCGPATSLTGLTYTSYANNVPGGCYFLLGNNVNTTGSASPYSKYRVIGSSIEVRWLGNTSAASAAVYEGTRMIVLPAVSDTQGNFNHTALSSMSTNTLMEQPFAKSALCPHVQNTKAIIIRNSMTTLKMFGYRFNSSLESEVGFSGAVSGASTYVNPTFIYDWIVRISSADDSASVTGDISVVIEYEVEFYGRTAFTSSVPG